MGPGQVCHLNPVAVRKEVQTQRSSPLIWRINTRRADCRQNVVVPALDDTEGREPTPVTAKSAKEVSGVEEQQAGDGNAEVQDSEFKANPVESQIEYPIKGLGAKQEKRRADSTDAVSSFLTRRFGLGGGLFWLGILAVGAIGEQIKTRLEVQNEEESAKEVKKTQEIVTASGLRYVDQKIGGGSYPQQEFLTVIQMRGEANGELYLDTRARGRAIVFIYGKRPFTGGLCLGVEEALASMRAGGKRRVTIPPELGFGSDGVTLFPDEKDPKKQGMVPPNATLIIDVELERVSVPPS